MAKWGFLARAYAIKEYAYLRATEAENGRPDKEADTLPEVISDIEIVLEMAEDNEDYLTAKQCKKFLKDFGG